MRKTRFSDEQIVTILREAEQSGKIGETIRRHVIARETFYRWRRKFGGRFNVGLEDVDDLVQDIARALRQAGLARHGIGVT